MDKKKADRIINVYNWMRVIILVLILSYVIIGLTNF